MQCTKGENNIYMFIRCKCLNGRECLINVNSITRIYPSGVFGNEKDFVIFVGDVKMVLTQESGKELIDFIL